MSKPKNAMRDFSEMCINIQGLTRLLYSGLNAKRGIAGVKEEELAARLLAEVSHLHAAVAAQKG